MATSPRHGAHMKTKDTSSAKNSRSSKGTRSAKSSRSAKDTRSATQVGTPVSAGHLSARTARVTRYTHPHTAARHGHDTTPHRPFVRFVVVLLLIALIAGLSVAAYTLVRPLLMSQKTGTGSTIEAGQQVTVTIPEGSGASEIAQMLVDNGVLSDSSDFLNELTKQGADSKLKPGTYTFVTGSTSQNVIDLLVAGPNSSAGTLVVPEGKTVTETASLVEQALGIPAEDFIKQAQASAYVDDYPFLKDAAATQQNSLEGYLYPKTYNFDGQNITADIVIRAMLDQYATEVASRDFGTAEGLLKKNYGVDLSDYQVLKLASIIEKEALTEEQRSKIASVFYNRLQVGMPLQSDTTMAYALGHEITLSKDNHQDSPYNSYDNKGVSIATPICSPSASSVQAALEPASTDYLYFWITQKDEHFSKTEEEHTKTYNDHMSSSGGN